MNYILDLFLIYRKYSGKKMSVSEPTKRFERYVRGRSDHRSFAFRYPYGNVSMSSKSFVLSIFANHLQVQYYLRRQLVLAILLTKPHR